MIEILLKPLLDYQRFAKTPRLARLIDETERRCGFATEADALDETWLEQVSAAGDMAASRQKEHSHGEH